ncbi:MAG: hypothetical protein V1736_01385 [Pseudomonadota bacterium]
MLEKRLQDIMSLHFLTIDESCPLPEAMAILFGLCGQYDMPRALGHAQK